MSVTENEMNEIIQFLLKHGWNKTNGERNDYLLSKFQLKNNVVKFFRSKKGITFYCNTEIMKHQILQREFISESEFINIIEIDDIGWGCPIAGVLIGFYSQPSTKLSFGIIEPKYFQTPLFEEKAYLDRTTALIFEELEKRNIEKSEWLIKICTGYIFKNAHNFLIEHKYNVITTQIVGTLQNYLENQFKKYLETNYSLPVNVIKTIPQKDAEYKDFFNQIILYIQKHPDILKYCKTGWKYFKEKGK